jgi:SulP family sulfate permease
MPKLPAPLLAVAAAIVGAYVLDLQHRSVELVGHIPQGLPSLVRPDLSLVSVLWPGALGIALMSFTETLAARRAFVRNDEPAPRANTELLATGLANVGGAASVRCRAAAAQRRRQSTSARERARD